MKTIKFMAWNKREKKMTKYFGYGKEYMVGGKGIALNELIRSEQEYFELLQFTGLNDKNGKELYKHFIFKRSDGQIGVIRNFIEDTYHLIQWVREGGSFEIIGSIYENLEISC